MRPTTWKGSTSAVTRASTAAAQATHQATAEAFQAPTWLTDLATLDSTTPFPGLAVGAEPIVVLDPRGEGANRKNLPESVVLVVDEDDGSGFEASTARHVVANPSYSNLRNVLETLKASLNVDALLVASPPMLCSELLAAGLVDKLSIVWNPIVDPSTEAVNAFPPTALNKTNPQPMQLLSAQALEGEILWVRYRPVDSDVEEVEE